MAVAAAASAPGRFALFKNYNFSMLMLGRTASNAGRSARVFARAWLVLELTGSPLLLGLVTSSLSWPMLFVPFVGGVLADRFDRRRLVLFTEFSLTALWLAVSIVITMGWIQWWHLMVSGVLSGVIQSVGRPGHDAMIGSVVTKEELPKAVAIDNAAEHWPRDIGLLLATLAVGWSAFGVQGIFWATAILQGITGLTLLFMKWKPEYNQVDFSSVTKRSAGQNFVEGLKHVKAEPVILGLVLISAASALFAGGHGFMLPVFARDVLGGGAQTLGWMQLLSALGTSVGAAAVMFFLKPGQRGKFLLVTTVVYTVLLFAFAQSTILLVSLALLFAMGLFSTVTRTMMIMIMQLLAPNEMRGRIMSLRVTVQGLSWIGTLFLGVVAEVLTYALDDIGLGVMYAVMLGAGIFILVVFAIYIKNRALWKLE